jgi:phosphotransferase system enzyme I (PtsI)
MSKKIEHKGISEGINIGYGLIYEEDVVLDTTINLIKSFDVSDNLSLFEKSLVIAKEELEVVYNTVLTTSPKEATIFLAHIEILSDLELKDRVVSLISDEFYSVKTAVIQGYQFFIDMLSEVEDPYIKERVLDIKDVRNRLVRVLSGKKEKSLSKLDKDVIVIAKDLNPSVCATMDKARVKGIITEIGGDTSHTAIIAKSYEIPAILGVKGITNEIKDNDTIILDAVDGKIIISPSEEEIIIYQEKIKKFLEKRELVRKYLDKDAVTLDNVRVNVSLNIGSANNSELLFSNFVDGVGLLRSEFLFMESTSAPDEDHQFEEYKKVLEGFKGKPVIIRTLDIGGDKKLDYLVQDAEENPFLGERAIRLCFANPGIFRTQLRALLRASLYGNLYIMVPMISSIDEIVKFKGLIEDYKLELDNENIKYGNYKIGIMIEIPSICLMASEVCDLVDFASFGTNDLCQYLLAVDRMNSKVSSYYQNLHPAMFRIMGIAIKEFVKRNKEISVCGELGGNLIGASILLGLGLRKLSMSKNKVASIKKMISSNEMSSFEKIAKNVIKLKNESDIIRYCEKTIIF